MQSQVNSFLLDPTNINAEILSIRMGKLGQKSVGTYAEQVFGNAHKIHIAEILTIMECPAFLISRTDLHNLTCWDLITF